MNNSLSLKAGEKARVRTSKAAFPCTSLRLCNSGSWSRSGMTRTLSTSPGTVSSQKKSKRSFMKIAIHHGLFALTVVAYEKPAGQSSVRHVEVVIWLP